MSKRDEHSRDERALRRAGVTVEQESGSRIRLQPPKGTSDRDKLVFLETAATAGLDNDAAVIVEGEPVTRQDLKAIRALLDETPANVEMGVSHPFAILRSSDS